MRLPILGKKLWEVMSGYVGTAMSRVRKSGDIRTCETIRFSTVIIPTMKPLDMPKKADKAEAAPAKVKKEEVIDFSKVEIEPLFADQVDFDTFSKSDFRAVKIKACEAVKKSKKLLQFVLDDGTGEDRIILSGIHEYYEPEELVGKTAIAIVNLPRVR